MVLVKLLRVALQLGVLFTMKFKKTDIIAEILEKHPKAEEILTSFGFHCLYCPCSQMESLEEACAVHEVDVNEVLKALNK